jgi:hypothetical protein
LLAVLATELLFALGQLNPGDLVEIPAAPFHP